MPTYPLPGQSQNTNDFVHPVKGVGVYSNWAIFSTNQLLSAMPLSDHTPGEGRQPHGIQMSRWFTGEETSFPMSNPGMGDRLDAEYQRFHPLEYKGLDSTRQLAGDYGHEPQRSLYYSLYSNLIFDGLEISEVLKSDRVGHEVRFFTEAAGQSGRSLSRR